MLNISLKTIISVCFSRDGMEHRYTPALILDLCVTVNTSRSSWKYSLVHNLIQYWRILFKVLKHCSSSKYQLD